MTSMRYLYLIIQIAGLLLLIVAAIPLIDFVETVDGLQIHSEVSGNTLYIIMDYNVSTPLKDYNITIYSNNTYLGSADGEVLNFGDTVRVSIPVEEFNPNNYTIAISGKVYGLYYVSVNLTKAS